MRANRISGFVFHLLTGRAGVSAGLSLLLALPLLGMTRPHPRHAPRRHAVSYRALRAHDVTAGEDPVIREAAIRALGNMRGTVVAVDPNTGRILAMVNQGLALSSDYQPCSTTKMAVSLAALSHGIVNENTPVVISRGHTTTLTTALAYSINAYFEALGRKMGWDTVTGFEREMGLGGRVGWNIPGESPGIEPTHPGPGGVAKLSSFGQGIHITPLQLASIAMTIANGGTMYWLQHPTTTAQIENFHPRVRRELPIAEFTPIVKDGMMAAVQYGTARRARIPGEQIFAKTGTCNRGHDQFGLVATFLGNIRPQLVVVVVLSGRNLWSYSGPLAAGVAGKIYRSLDRRHLFLAEGEPGAGLPHLELLTDPQH